MWTERLRDSSDRGGALSRSSNDTAEAADSDDVDSGVSPEHVHAQDCPDPQESDVAISLFALFHVWCRVQRCNYCIGALRMRNSRKAGEFLPIKLEIMLMLIASHCPLLVSLVLARLLGAKDTSSGLYCFPHKLS